jgi:hypothetical protein
MKPGEYDMVEKSTCTTCTFSEDFRCVRRTIKDGIKRGFGGDVTADRA